MMGAMARPPALSIREVLLDTIKKEPKSTGGGPPTRTSVLQAAAQALGFQHDENKEEALLTEWGELFRTGLLAWGKNLNSPDPPWFHLTERGRTALERLTHDPSNPSGYLRHLASVGQLNPIAHSYLVEALECYVAGLFKASAVMVGAAAESVILGLRDKAVQRLNDLGKPVPSSLTKWQIKTVTDALTILFNAIDTKQDRALREMYEAYWAAFPHQVRTIRNDAGHPRSIDPVTENAVHASFLVFPELVRLEAALSKWIAAGFTSI